MKIVSGVLAFPLERKPCLKCGIGSKGELH